MARASTDDDELVREIHDRYADCIDKEDASRKVFEEALRFRYGDPHNHWQWSDAAWMARNRPGTAALPALTLNKIDAHCNQVENQCRQTQMGIKVSATGFGATEKAADAIEGIIRHVETQSNAQQNAYANAIKHQITGGVGWVHWRSDYVVGANSFDQDLFCDAVPNPLDVYSDPACRQPDHSDMQWAMWVTTMPRAEFEREYPDDDALDAADAPLTLIDQTRNDDWESKETVRVARYYRKSIEKDTLWNVPAGLSRMVQLSASLGQTATDTSGSPSDQAGDQSSQEKAQPDTSSADGTPTTNTSVTTKISGPTRQSDMPDALVEACKTLRCQSRPIEKPRVEWVLLGGSRVIDRGDTVFEYIPLVPCLGVETWIDGQLHRKGMVTGLIDAQRMFNQGASKFAESLAAQTQTPWLVNMDTISPYKDTWDKINLNPKPYAPYTLIGTDGGPIIGGTKPERIDPPTMSQGYMQAMTNADQQMQSVSGQYQSELGAPGNEKSGRAITERQRQADTANYHFTDNQGMFLRLCGKVVLSALPRVYDTQRVMQILGLDGTMQTAIMDPGIATAHQVVHPPGTNVDPEMDVEKQLAMQGAILAINPTIGRYDVEADVGPAFATRRQDAAANYMQIVQAAPELIGKIGDLVFRALDEPLSDEIADRLKPTSDDPQLQAAMQHITALTQQNASLQAALKTKQDNLQHGQVTDLMRLDLDKQRAHTDQFRAETDRVSDLKDVNPGDVVPLLRQTVMDMLREMFPTGLPPAVAANAANAQTIAPPQPQMQQQSAVQ